MSDSNDAFKQVVEAESLAFITSLSPGAALSALVKAKKTPLLDKIVKDISVANIPMPLSSQKQHDMEIMINEMSINDSSLLIKGGKEGKKKSELKGKKLLIIDESYTIPDQEDKEKTLRDNRAIAIADLFERKREEYREQGRAEIRRHLATSKQRLAKLEQKLKLSSEKKEKLRLEKIKKRVELPIHLQSGANNHYQISEALKSCWYDKIAENYLLKRGNQIVKKENKELEKNEEIKTFELSHIERKKKPSKIIQEKKFLIGLKDSPGMFSLNTEIEMGEDACQYFKTDDDGSKIEQKERKHQIRKMFDSISRNKQITTDALIRNGVNEVNDHRLSSIKPEKIEEETILVNIVEDEEIPEEGDEKSLARSRSFKSQFSRDEKIGIISRRSFLLERNNSRIMGDCLSPQSNHSKEENRFSTPKSQTPITAVRANQLQQSLSLKNDPHAISTIAKLDDSFSQIVPKHEERGVIKDRKKVIEPLTWDEMLIAEEPKIAAPERVPLSKWFNPEFN